MVKPRAHQNPGDVIETKTTRQVHKEDAVHFMGLHDSHICMRSQQEKLWYNWLVTCQLFTNT